MESLCELCPFLYILRGICDNKRVISLLYIENTTIPDMLYFILEPIYWTSVNINEKTHIINITCIRKKLLFIYD